MVVAFGRELLDGFKKFGCFEIKTIRNLSRGWIWCLSIRCRRLEVKVDAFIGNKGGVSLLTNETDVVLPVRTKTLFGATTIFRRCRSWFMSAAADANVRIACIDSLEGGHHF